jgi:hypothetical protein
MNRKNAGSGKPALAASVAIDSGPVVVDAVGDIFVEVPNITAQAPHGVHRMTLNCFAGLFDSGLALSSYSPAIVTIFACDSNNKCFGDFAVRHCALADVERTDLRRERWRTILADLLVTNCALGLLLKRQLELGIHESLLVGRRYLVILSDAPRPASSSRALLMMQYLNAVRGLIIQALGPLPILWI